jgi:hypothetical protein
MKNIVKSNPKKNHFLIIILITFGILIIISSLYLLKDVSIKETTSNEEIEKINQLMEEFYNQLNKNNPEWILNQLGDEWYTRYDYFSSEKFFNNLHKRGINKNGSLIFHEVVYTQKEDILLDYDIIKVEYLVIRGENEDKDSFLLSKDEEEEYYILYYYLEMDPENYNQTLIEILEHQDTNL